MALPGADLLLGNVHDTLMADVIEPSILAVVLSAALNASTSHFATRTSTGSFGCKLAPNRFPASLLSRARQSEGLLNTPS